MLIACGCDDDGPAVERDSPEASALGLVSSSTGETTARELVGVFEATEWTFDGNVVESQARLRIEFSRTRLSATADCNESSAAFNVIDGRLVVRDLAETLVECGEPDAPVRELIGSEPTVTLHGDRLVLDAGHHHVALERAS
jgi:heat shock protein HslJ